MEKKTLVKKLSEVMEQMKRVPKNGFNAFHKYQYATESDVSDVVREELAKRSVMMIPSVESQTTREHKNARGNTEYIATVNMLYTFHDGDSGESIEFRCVGEGQDAGDKAVYKAMTGATKYAIMKTFLISTGDDPEADTKVDERNAYNKAPQRKAAPQAQKPPSKPSDEIMNTIYQLVNIVAQKVNKTPDEVSAGFRVNEIETQTQASVVADKLRKQIEKLEEKK